MSEELGLDFVKNMMILSIIGEDTIEFPEHTKNSRGLRTNDGKMINMKGKKYFFIAINTNEFKLNISHTEFDDFKWLDYKQAQEFTEKIHQEGKKRITVNALKALRSLDLL